MDGKAIAEQLNERLGADGSILRMKVIEESEVGGFAHADLAIDMTDPYVVLGDWQLSIEGIGAVGRHLHEMGYKGVLQNARFIRVLAHRDDTGGSHE